MIGLQLLPVQASFIVALKRIKDDNMSAGTASFVFHLTRNSTIKLHFMMKSYWNSFDNSFIFDFKQKHFCSHAKPHRQWCFCLQHVASWKQKWDLENCYSSRFLFKISSLPNLALFIHLKPSHFFIPGDNFYVSCCFPCIMCYPSLFSVPHMSSAFLFSVRDQHICVVSCIFPSWMFLF